MTKKLLCTVVALTLAGSLSVMAATTDVALYAPKERTPEQSHLNSSLAYIGSLLKKPLYFVMFRSTAPAKSAEISRGLPRAASTELQAYGSGKPGSEEPATAAVALYEHQANPTPAAHTGYEVMVLNPVASVEVAPGVSGILSMFVRRAAYFIGLGGVEEKASRSEVELNMYDLSHDSSTDGSSEEQAVYLACYSRPDYEIDKGYLVKGNFRVLGFLRVNGTYAGIKAIPEHVERNDNPEFGWDISQPTHMYSRHCNNFIEECMSFENGEQVSNCWAGGETWFIKNTLDSVHKDRYKVTWKEAGGLAGNSTTEPAK